MQRQFISAFLHHHHYPLPRAIIQGKGHRIYPYRLRGLTIDWPNQVWANVLSYIPLARGFMYVVAVMEWHSCQWQSGAVLAGLQHAGYGLLCRCAGGRTDTPRVIVIFNTGQSCKFTSQAFIGVLEAHNVTTSMDGKGCLSGDT